MNNRHDNLELVVVIPKASSLHPRRSRGGVLCKPEHTRYGRLVVEQITILALSDKCEPVSEWPVTVALCRTELAPLGESGGAVKLEIGP